MSSDADIAVEHTGSGDGRRHAAPPSAAFTLLRLMRLPTVFTAFSNILCGYLLTHKVTVAQLTSESDLLLLLTASAGLYLGGMVLNDVCDAALDAVERPERPIPSGQISRRQAAAVAVSLMLIGVVAAAMAGPASLAVSLLLTLQVVGYDVWLKNTVAGPLSMGLCRFLNVLLGGSAAAWADLWQLPLCGAATGLLVYVLGVTWFARNEAGTSSRRSLIASVAVLMCGTGIAAAVMTASASSATARQGGLTALLLIALHILFRTGAAVADPQPRRVQQTVGLLLLSIILIDAALVFAMTGDGSLAAIVVALVLPARLMRRIIPLS